MSEDVRTEDEVTSGMFVLYKNNSGFRSAKTNKYSYNKKPNSAVVYKSERYARMAKNVDDVIVPVSLTIKWSDVALSIIKG